MQHTSKKVMALLTIAAVMIASTPVSAAWTKTKKEAPAPKATPVTQPVNQPNVNPSVQNKQNTQVSNAQILALLSQYLTPEQIEQLMEFINGMPYVLTPEQQQTLIDAAKAIAQEAPYVLTEEQLTALIEALKTAAEDFDGENLDELAQIIANLQEFVDDNSLENSVTSRNMAKATILALDRSIMVYTNSLMVSGVPGSTLDELEKTLIHQKLADIHYGYDASWDRMQNLDTSDPASAAVIRAEIENMYYNESHTSYFEVTARPELSAIQTLILEPTLRYILQGLQMGSESLNQKVDLFEQYAGYADTARAQIMGINYLVGRRDIAGVTEQRINEAVELARKVLYESTQDRPALFAGYAMNDMVTAAEMMQDTLQLVNAPQIR